MAALGALDDSREPVAEINRRVGALAKELGLPRPSYAQIRRLLRADRLERAERREHRERVAEAILTRHYVYDFLSHR